MRFLLMIAGVALAGASMAADTASGGLPLSAAQAQALALERNQDLAIAKSTVASARANVQPSALTNTSLAKNMPSGVKNLMWTLILTRMRIPPMRPAPR